MKHVKQPAPVPNTNAIVAEAAGATTVVVKEVVKEASEEPKKDSFEDLKKLKDLKDAGIITEEEYEKKKEEILKKI